jgi:HPt (histidine-containing phosphotransfer) domain-containing protein
MRYVKNNDPSKWENSEPEKNKDVQHTPRYVNFDYLKELTGKNPDGLVSLVKTYIEETPKLIEKIRQGIQKEDWKSVGAAAHAMIPSFSVIGMGTEFEEKAREIQDLSDKKENFERIRELFSQIEKVCSLALEELEKELPTLETH